MACLVAEVLRSVAGLHAAEALQTDAETLQGGSRGNSPRRVLRVVEFFAGMGGMRCAGDLSGEPLEVVACYEISEICQQAYRHNFGTRELRVRTIERLSVEELDGLSSDVWLMSPPCQPFTRSGRRRDHEDNRTLALLNLIRLLGEMQHPPRYLLLENVIGFERSESRRRLLAVLARLGWRGAELGLDPESFGLPNRRPRYYGLFRAEAGSDEGTSPWCRWRSAAELLGVEAAEGSEEAAEGVEGPPPVLQSAPWQARRPPPLGSFLQAPEALAAEEARLGASLEVPQEVLQQRAEKEGKSDLHLRSDRTSACLTKTNGRLPRGFSPLVLLDEAEAGNLEQRPKISVQGEGPGAATDHVWQPGVRVRYLSPVEQLRLMGYPETYAFPPQLGFRETAGLIGNSLNVRVVSWLIRLLLSGRGAEAETWHAEGAADALQIDAARLVAQAWGPRKRYS